MHLHQILGHMFLYRIQTLASLINTHLDKTNVQFLGRVTTGKISANIVIIITDNS